jgi:hypothetical protein
MYANNININLTNNDTDNKNQKKDLMSTFD